MATMRTRGGRSRIALAANWRDLPTQVGTAGTGTGTAEMVGTGTMEVQVHVDRILPPPPLTPHPLSPSLKRLPAPHSPKYRPPACPNPPPRTGPPLRSLAHLLRRRPRRCRRRHRQLLVPCGRTTAACPMAHNPPRGSPSIRGPRVGAPCTRTTRRPRITSNALWNPRCKMAAGVEATAAVADWKRRHWRRSASGCCEPYTRVKTVAIARGGATAAVV
mmetsp:Transcript_8216/g.20372  ORF Transcript_8216/g.20372 Transcript_8216/m.20372 type:complete len:218 (+) Transcript_8216:1881-2534(+)